MDLSDSGDRNGFRYLLGATDKTTGKAHLRRYIKGTHISDIKVITFDRGGDFYDYFWLYEATFGEFIRENNIRHLASPLRILQRAAQLQSSDFGLHFLGRHGATSGLNQQDYSDAMIYAVDVYN